MNVKAIDAALTAYGQMVGERDASRLAFFRKLWEVEKTGEALSSPYEPPSSTRLQQLYEAGRPVFSEVPVMVEGAALCAMLERLCACVKGEDAFPLLATAALERVTWDRMVAAGSPSQAGEDPAAYLEELAVILTHDGMGPDQLAVALPLAALAVRSLIAGAASAVTEVLNHADIHEPHALHCPICGGQAAVARVGGAGAHQGRTKTLWCGQCGGIWEFERVRCARCGTQNQGHLHYFNIEGDEAHRLATCEECGAYVRTVYAEDMLGPFSFEVEDVVMARLDAIAREPSFAGSSQDAPQDTNT